MEEKDIHIAEEAKTKSSDFEIRYCVVIEKDANARDGYDYLHPDEFKGKFTVNDFCTLTYYYKSAKKHNPNIIIENICGENFTDRKKIINHFLKHFALKYSVECDGFYKGL